MRIKPVKLAITIAVILVIFFIYILLKANSINQTETIESTNQTANQNIKNTITFRVSIPENTPKEDSVYIYLSLPEGKKKFKMQKIGQFIYEKSFSDEEIGFQNEIIYRYSRNGYDFHTAEYLEPDTNDYFWTELGRKTTFQLGKVQEDKIIRWRWFPEGNISITKTTNIEPAENFLARINNLEFRSGQTIEDLYTDSFYEFFNSTAKRMKKMNYNWVEIDPPWQWTESNGLPKIINDYENNPNYPNDEIFLEEVKAYKQEGLKVMIGPQICCNTLNTKNKSIGWWQAYFNETEKFLVHFAKLAQREDADAFFYAIPSWEIEQAPMQIDIEKEWRKIFSSIREVFDGEVGQMIWILGPEISASPQPIPNSDFVKWGDELDFFIVATEFPLSDKDNPTDEELKNKAIAVLDGVKEFYDKFQKPIIIRNGYFNVKYSWKGQSFYQIDSVQGFSDPESKINNSVYEFNTFDQARTINAYFQAIAERPWVIGYFYFGYTHWEYPLSPWMSINGKQSEDLWMKWNKIIYFP